jgi:hypothetical protein
MVPADTVIVRQIRVGGCQASQAEVGVDLAES